MADDKLTIAQPTAQLATVETEAASLLNVIARAAQDPTVDPAKMRELLQLQRDVMADRARAAYRAALAKLQAELPQVEKTGRIEVDGKLRSRFAKLEDIDRAIRPICAAHGFSFSFDSKPGPNGTTYTCEMSHDGGHAEMKTLTLPTDTGAGRNAVQSVGSTTSYARRYLLGMHLNLVTKDEDDDGQGGQRLITPEQAEELRTTLEKVGGNPKRFLAHFKCTDFTGIMEKQLATAQRMIAEKGKGR